MHAEEVRLFPQERSSWGLRNLFAPIGALFMGPSHFYGERRIQVDTTPPGATLDLFYVRASFQKRYEQTHAPATVILPARVDTGPRDSVTIRAFVEGHRIQDVILPVGSRQDEVLIELAPLPNVLEAVGHTYFGGRATLSFLTRQVPVVRLQQRETGFSVVLNETAKSAQVDDALVGIASPLIASVDAQQLGEDLLVQVKYAQSGDAKTLELRSRQGLDQARGLHDFALDLIPPGGDAALVERARAALGRVEPRDVAGCAAVFDEGLRQALDAAALARALAPRGAFVDPYLRAAMKRLGDVSPGGVVTLVDGSRFRSSVPIELAAATTQGSQAQGYLALLRRFVAELVPPPQRRETLRSLVAPELGSGAFAAALESAESRERRCAGVTNGKAG